MSYVECMECREKLKYVAPTHLEKHGLTSKEYREIYPTAPMRSSDLRKRHSDFRRGMRLNRNCRKCGRPFTTGSTRAYYCRDCQRVRDILKRREASLRYFRRLRNSGKVCLAGTFGESYLEIVDGRVRGAVLLEKDMSFIICDRSFFKLFPYSSSPPEYEETSTITIYLILWKRKPYCGECGSELTVARQNEDYTIPAEICCKSCGLVYEEFPTRKPRNPKGLGRPYGLGESWKNLWLPKTVRRDLSVKETFGTTSWGRR